MQQGRSRVVLMWLLNQTPRLKILIFLIYQMTMSSPDAEATARNKQSPQADYMRFLPKDIPLPTFYSEDERTLLTGTSLADALEQKLASLDKEFEAVRELTSSLPWFKQLWWHNETGILTFDDWKLADAMYRSRALELPGGVGDSMVPVVDMANHASDNRSNARFEVDQDGNALLLVRDEKSIASGDEITIMYGVGGACEMIFSYGFLEEGASSAREMFISLRIPEDDPLRMAKVRCAQEAPGVRVFVGDTGIPRWDSSYVWWACVNEEDGLDFRVVQTNDGQKELRVFWKDHEFDPSKLKQMVLADVLRDVFVLRATVLIQQRLESQGTALTSTEQAFDTAREVLTIREWIWKLVGRLRELELDVVAATFEQLDEEVRSPCFLSQHEDPAANATVCASA